MTGAHNAATLHREIAMRRPLRIAMVTTFYPPYSFGGDGQYVRRLAHALVRRGHEVVVVHDVDAYRLLGSGAEQEPLTEPKGLTVHSLRSRAPAMSCLATQQLGRPLVHGPRTRLGVQVIPRGAPRTSCGMEARSRLCWETSFSLSTRMSLSAAI